MTLNLCNNKYENFDYLGKEDVDIIDIYEVVIKKCAMEDCESTDFSLKYDENGIFCDKCILRISGTDICTIEKCNSTDFSMKLDETGKICDKCVLSISETKLEKKCIMDSCNCSTPSFTRENNGGICDQCISSFEN